MCVAARVSRAFFAIFLQPRLALPKMALCAEQRFQISIRPLALVRQGSCVKEHTEFSGSIPAAYDRYLGHFGNRYADFNPASGDKVASYGIAALVAGGVAAKLGFFKGLWVLILRAKKFIIIGIAAVAAWFRKLFGKKRMTPG